MANNKKTKKHTPKTGSLNPSKTEPRAKTTPKKSQNETALVEAQKDNLFLDDYMKVRRMSLQLYSPPETWGSVLLEAVHWAYVYHDKDVNADGTPKTPHYHLLLVFQNQRYRRAVRKLFDIPEEGENSTINFQRMGNATQCYHYLRHFTADAQAQGKHLYTPEEVHCDDVNFWEDTSSPETTPNFDFLADLERLDRRQMALLYGRDYIKNYRRYDDFIQTLRFDEEREKLSEALTVGERIVRNSTEWNYDVNEAIALFVATYVKANLAMTFSPERTEYECKTDAHHYINNCLVHIAERAEELLYKEGADI